MPLSSSSEQLALVQEHLTLAKGASNKESEAAARREGPAARAVAYLDDVSLLAPPELAAEALAAAGRHLAALRVV